MERSDRRHASPDTFASARDSATPTPCTAPVGFAGTDNPRHLRALQALIDRSLSREEIDRIVGCSNGPDLIADLRGLGLGKRGLPCQLVTGRDRDGRPTRYGIYYLSDLGRRAVGDWLRKIQRGGSC
ncbi:hypothetical protein [Cupriavidus sp. IK-TO18]|uniref:hypothetical protein n=1 Tax=Cupriavidus sp. IK-TO18 TaxID=2782182 RepID=UPI00189798D7|nr:hypothetical protein [Cupriavidus sp. IK-TO18]MBF6990933.1 hypothetical protein [Cupriavidus sp. IK-TO18]